MLNVSGPTIWRLPKFIKIELNRQSVRYFNVVRSAEKKKSRKEEKKDKNIIDLVQKFKPTNDPYELREFLFNISLNFL